MTAYWAGFLAPSGSYSEGRLPEQTNALLSVAAIIGQDFDLDTLEAAT